ncbi:hypothetical protein NMY22_g8680 [Coprinellus aureogranulatus]|nr:hypothetical protein NMY22_g8680 [Coprinellus aureogranulatus]
MELQVRNSETEEQPQTCDGRWIWKQGYTNMNYELPPVARSLRDGFQGMYQSAAVVSALLAGIGAQLYGFFKTPSNFSEGTSQTLRDIIVATCCISIILNVGATTTVSLIAWFLARMQYYAATASTQIRPELPAAPFFPHLAHRNGDADFIVEGIFNVMSSYNKLQPSLRLLAVHWVVSFASGVLTLLFTVLLYIGVEEQPNIKAITSLAGIFAVIPLLIIGVFTLRSMLGNSLRRVLSGRFLGPARTGMGEHGVSRDGMTRQYVGTIMMILTCASLRVNHQKLILILTGKRYLGVRVLYERILGLRL